jgi:hypothetical protein
MPHSVIRLTLIGATLLILTAFPIRSQAKPALPVQLNMPNGLESAVKAAIGTNYRPLTFANTQQAKLLTSDRAINDQLGISVALSADGNTALVGAYTASGATTNNSGAAYVFTRSAGIWMQQAKLTASSQNNADLFGVFVSLSGDGNTAIVGAYRTDDSSGPQDTGAAYVFTRSAGMWTQQAKLTASDPSFNDRFGISVTLSGDGNTALVGAYLENSNGKSDNGATYVFTRSAGVWTQQAKLLASDLATGDYFGVWGALSSDGNTALIGSYYSDDGGKVDNGAAYVFTRSAGMWTEQAKLTASDKADSDNFGVSVALSSDGNTALIGSYYSNDTPTVSNGAAYVFTHSAGVWTQQSKLVATDKTDDVYFGVAVSLSSDGNTALIGAYYSSDDGLDNNGAAYMFTRSAGAWTQQVKLLASDKASSDYFGASVALSSDGNTALVGAYYESTAPTTQNGAAYVFTGSSPMPTVTATTTNTATVTVTNTRTATLTTTATSTTTATRTNTPTLAATNTVAPTATVTTTRTPSATATDIPIPETIGLFNSGVWYLRYTNTTGIADITSVFGNPTDLPIVGDWDGDFLDTLGIYRNAEFILSNSNTTPAADFDFSFGNPGDTPLAGKWDANTPGNSVGVYRTSNGIAYLKRTKAIGAADYSAVFGSPGDLAVTGDWNHDGFDSLGVYRNANNFWYLANANASGAVFPDVFFTYPVGANQPLSGDWDGDGVTTVGYYNPTLGVFALHPSLVTAGTDTVFAFGAGGGTGIRGNWSLGFTPPSANIIVQPNQPPVNGAVDGAE